MSTGTKISDLPELTTGETGDWLLIVDVSDTSGAPSGTTKKINVDNVGNYLGHWAMLQGDGSSDGGLFTGTGTGFIAYDDVSYGMVSLLVQSGNTYFEIRATNEQTQDLIAIGNDYMGFYSYVAIDSTGQELHVYGDYAVLEASSRNLSYPTDRAYYGGFYLGDTAASVEVGFPKFGSGDKKAGIVITEDGDVTFYADTRGSGASLVNFEVAGDPVFTVNDSGAITTLNGVSVPLATYTVSNPTTTRSLDEVGASTTDVAKVLGTLITDLRTAGILA